MICTGYEWVDAPDTKRRTRKPLLFELVPLEAFDSPPDRSEGTRASDREVTLESLSELRRRALADSTECTTPVERRALYRMRSRAVRQYVLVRAAGKCEGCGSSAPFTTKEGQPYLEPHHIRRLTDGGPDDPRWVVGVCPNCHRRAHYSHDAAEYNKKLAEVVFRLEN